MGAPLRRLGPVIIRTQNTVPSERLNGNNRSIFLTRLWELGRLGQLKEQELYSLCCVVSLPGKLLFSHL